MAKLDEIVQFLDSELNTAEVPDYPGAINGLQLESAGEVTKIVAAVDASLPVIEKAVEAGGDLLIVHHGMFWQGAQPLTRAFYRKIKVAMEAGMAVYSSHIPLDVHPVWGNNVGLAAAIGLKNPEPFFDYKGIKLGIRGQWAGGDRASLHDALNKALGVRVHLCPGGEEVLGDVGIITGGAGSELAKVADEGIHTFVTGEGPHWSYPLAEELGMNLFYGGHYATEVYGVQMVASEISTRFDVPWEFINHPTGL